MKATNSLSALQDFNGRPAGIPPARRAPKGIAFPVKPTSHSDVVHQPPLPRRTFRSKYCELQGIASETFIRHLFFRCVRPWAMPVLGLLWVFKRSALENDFRLIGEVAEAITYREFQGALETFTYRNRESGFLREVLRIRMSANLLMKFGSRLLGRTDREVQHAEQDIYAAVKPGGQPLRVRRQSARRF